MMAQTSNGGDKPLCFRTQKYVLDVKEKRKEFNV